MSGPIASVPVSAPATETSDAVKVALSGKGMKDENFPVASFMLARRHRPVVVAYYRFARTADDVADSGVLPPDVKVAALDIMQAVLEGREDPALSPEAAALRRDLLERGIPLHLASDLLTAFRTDSRGLRCRTWDDLLAYCTYSANPVGRFLLRLHGARVEADGPSDALCTALQILNHLQDLREDWMRLGRLYLPLEWIEAAGGCADDLARSPTPDLFRPLIQRALDLTDPLIAQQITCPASLAIADWSWKRAWWWSWQSACPPACGQPRRKPLTPGPVAPIGPAAALRALWSGIGGRP